eukprot:s529_g15.t1
MKSFSFEELGAQTGCRIRFVPADAHWQLGRAERHGDVAREIANRLIVHHGTQTATEMEEVLTMAAFAKNQLIRRAGVSPSQWLFGRSPRIPGSLLSEGRLVQVAREQARALEEEEAWLPGAPDFRLLRDAEQDLEAKHAIGFDQRQDALPDVGEPPLLALPEPQQDQQMPPLDSLGQPAVAATLQWHTSEVLVVKSLAQITSDRKTDVETYPITSYASWFEDEETWLWEKVHNHDTDVSYDEFFGDGEWSEWQKWSSCRAILGAKVAKQLILPSRVCFKWKPTPNTGGYKAKARIVIQGFRDPHLPLLTRDAPVLSRNGLMTLLQWSACFQTTLWNADAKSAFLQGLPDDERPTKIYMKPPTDGISIQGIPEWNDDILYELIAPVYGAANAPRRWYGRFRSVAEGLRWRVHSLDPCLFLWIAELKTENGETRREVVALLGVHVDDIIVTARKGWEELTVDPEACRK